MHFKTRLALILAVSAFGAALAPAPSSAAYQIRDVSVAEQTKFASEMACAPTAVSLPLERGAFGVSVISGPHKGQTLFGPGDSEQKVGVVTDVRVRPEGRNEVTWDAKPLPGGCRPHYGDAIAYDENGNDVYGPPEYYFWDSDTYDFEVFYKVRRRIQLTRRSAAKLASTALSRKFGSAYDTADGYPRCRRPRRNRSTCVINFFQGDVYWTGHVRVGVKTTRNHRKLRWSYGLNVIFVNDYCHQVNNRPLSECSRRIHKRRKGLRVPGGSL